MKNTNNTGAHWRNAFNQLLRIFTAVSVRTISVQSNSRGGPRENASVCASKWVRGRRNAETSSSVRPSPSNKSVVFCFFFSSANGTTESDKKALLSVCLITGLRCSAVRVREYGAQPAARHARNLAERGLSIRIAAE